MLAGIGVGVYKDEQDAFEHVRRPGRVYQPDVRLHRTYAEGFELYRRMYPALKDVHHRMG
jgi:xylulokinase